MHSRRDDAKWTEEDRVSACVRACGFIDDTFHLSLPLFLLRPPDGFESN